MRIASADSANGGAVLVAPLQIPVGSVITRVDVSGVDRLRLDPSRELDGHLSGGVISVRLKDGVQPPSGGGTATAPGGSIDSQVVVGSAATRISVRPDVAYSGMIAISRALPEDEAEAVGLRITYRPPVPY